MRDHDPWVFAMLWEAEHREEMRRLADSRLAREAHDRLEARSFARPGATSRVTLRQLIQGVPSVAWPRLRRPPRQSEGGT
jgi:hypothetical protein